MTLKGGWEFPPYRRSWSAPKVYDPADESGTNAGSSVAVLSPFGHQCPGDSTQGPAESQACSPAGRGQHRWETGVLHV